ncbi:hypothetical protein [Bacillus sonorensis]|uniref:hypothetical protein n=1 Tax=Bacillus sonorensis TaxID=119858 RepID=UPI001FC96E95|nr:hypothetical protein [Bacillus sonorensis]
MFFHFNGALGIIGFHRPAYDMPALFRELGALIQSAAIQFCLTIIFQKRLGFCFSAHSFARLIAIGITLRSSYPSCDFVLSGIIIAH